MSQNWKRSTALFLSSQGISLFGSTLVQYAISWHITLETQSGLMMTVAVLCGFLPTCLLSPFAGVWADRYPRKLLIVLSDAGIALATLGLAILFRMGYDALWLLFAVSAIRALGAGVQMPAIGAFLPQFVPEDKLTRVNATNSSIQSAVMLVSPMLSGALLTWTALETIFFIDVVTAGIAILILLLLLRVPAHAKATATQGSGYLADMRQGFTYVRSHALVKQLCVFNAVFFILIAPSAFLTPLQVARSFGDDVWRLTALELVFSVGMLAGGAIMAVWGVFTNKVHTLVFANVIISVCTFALGVVPVFWFYLCFVAFTGVAIPLFNTPFTVLLQQKVEADFLGRVFGVFGMISSMAPAGMLLFGPIADVVRIEWLLIATGLLLLAQSLIMLGSRVLVEGGQPTPRPDSGGAVPADTGA
jgi:DHA3 family macrolide efflux protein-like MFS transporter